MRTTPGRAVNTTMSHTLQVERVLLGVTNIAKKKPASRIGFCPLEAIALLRGSQEDRRLVTKGQGERAAKS
jgi:hypothetical protein